MGQMGFFDLGNRYSGLDAKNEPLLKIDGVVPWEDLRARLEAVWRRADKVRKSRAGRKPWDAIVMFKTIILCALYNLSDDQVEHQIRDRLSFMRFLGLGLEGRVPDAKTVWLYREQLTQAGVIEALFETFDGYLRVRPGTLCRITEFSEHESNGRELDEGERVAVEVLPVLGQSAAAVEPGDGAFDHPTPGLDDEALHPIGSLDDLGLEIGQDAGQGAVKDRALIGAVGEQFPEKGKQTEQGRQQRETAVAILNVGGGDDAVQQQALRIDQNMPLLALDQLAGIEAVAVDASPPFSALFTL